VVAEPTLDVKENTPPAIDGIDFEATIFIAKASKDPHTMPAKP
jgi:hypothetical protein